MERLKLFIPVFVFAFLAVVLMYALIRGDTGHVESALLDKPVPEFTMPSLFDEKPAVSGEEIKGKPYLLNLWGTWCAPCKKEHPELVALSKKGVRIIGVNHKDDKELALKWLEEHQDPYEAVIFDDTGRFGLDLGITGLPETFFVDADGVIRYKHTGPISEYIWNTKLASQWQALQAPAAN
ncbi:DsbE family thiol:disulfide interchange protein [Saccharophagus degradans]|uniref:Periplasmic protein thiol n=1 Tax=Saccharophagus degradans (strain 2-40 / ATCC 43961 / DSM 17024) TaxID=203122 RepID=Q21JJ7_SACD2|nr:DsbE family thiol:disulfide interchange protein [Saccharophagus degradans]ABD81132.1 periplasmic protein thiol [Saccharophagus degradans 2-40]